MGRFTAVDPVSYARGMRVIVRTSRGLEIGEVLSTDEATIAAGDAARGTGDGALIRRMTVEDELLAARLERHRFEALEACAARIEKLGISATLIDVEPLFDGRSLFFYFLGEPPPEVEAIRGDLAAEYDAVSQFTRFAETLTAGCGPDCGTGESSGCVSCVASCGIASACGTRKRASGLEGGTPAIDSGMDE